MKEVLIEWKWENTQGVFKTKVRFFKKTIKYWDVIDNEWVTIKKGYNYNGNNFMEQVNEMKKKFDLMKKLK